MKKVIQLSALIVLMMLGGCTTPGHVNMPMTTKYDITQFEQKKVAYNITYQDPEHGMFGDGDMLPPMAVSEAHLDFQTRRVFNEFNRILASQIPSNALITNKQQPDFTLKVKFVAHDSGGPVVVEDKFGETLLKSAISLGFAPYEQEVVADFDVTYTVVDKDGETLFTQKYKVNDEVDHEKSNIEFTNESGKNLAGQLFERNLTLTLNEFMKEFATKS